MTQQEVWRKRLAAAEQVYRKAAQELRGAVQENRQDRIAELRELKLAARTEYVRVLHIFTDLILRGKPPRAKE